MTWKHVVLIFTGATLAAFGAALLIWQPNAKPETLFTIATGIIVGAYGHAKSDKTSNKDT